MTATIIATCFAVLQLGGRVFFSQLHRFEGAINTVLGGNIVVQGIEGRWQGLNPGVFAERVRFRSGELVGFDFELDVIESLARNRVVARHMTVADGRLVVEKTAAGWRLQGARADSSGFDAVALFMHSDGVWIRGRVIARDRTHTATLHVESWLINVGGGHRFSVRLQSEPQCTDCALAIEGDIDEDGPGTINVAAGSFSLGRELYEMLGIPYFEAAVAGDWSRTPEGNARVRLEIDVARLQTPGAESAVRATLGAWSEGGSYRGRIDSLSVASGEHAHEFPKAGFRLRNERGAQFADIWLPEFSAADVAEVAVAAFGTDHVVGRWLSNLKPEGRIDDLRVRIDDDGAAFACRGREVAIAAYRGVPAAANLAFSAAGHAGALRVDVDSYDLALAMPDFVPANETYPSGGGSIIFSFGSGHLGVRGKNLWLDRDRTRAVVDFALSRPLDSAEVLIAADLKVDRVAVDAAHAYLPHTVAPGLRTWLQKSVRAGRLEDGRILFQGDVGAGSGALSRHYELSATLVDGVIDYHADWPTATDIDAALVIAGKTTRLRGSATVFDTALSEVDLRVPPEGGRLALRVRSRVDTGQLVGFAWRTPVRNALPFLSETWTGAGSVMVDAEMDLPLAAREGDGLRLEELSVEFGLEGVDIDLADFGLGFHGLNDIVRYEWPRGLTSETLVGTLFGAPVRVAIDSDDTAIRVALSGAATVDDAYRVLGFANPGIAAGEFDFEASLQVFPNSDHPPELRIHSDLMGVAVALPQPLGKPPGDVAAFAVSAQFLDDYVAVSVGYDDSSGWLHVADDGVRAAALGLGEPIPMVDSAAGRVVIAGGLDSVDAASMAALFGDPGGDDPPLAWELRRFRVDRIVFDTMELADVQLDGHSEAGEVRLDIVGRELRGTLARSGAAPWRLELAELRVAAAEGERVPMDPAVIDQLLAADVVLDRVFVGDADYGSWRFGLRPVPGGVELHDVVAEVKGLAIESTAPVLWSKDGTTRFEGTVAAGDLRDVLPLWGFVPSVESESFFASGNLSWPGSPLEFDLATLSGEASLDLTKGRFLDVEQGAGASRIMSLINFSTIVKRMSFDFTDVFGRGIGFDRVLADLAVTDGLARFVQPARITGTGLRFEIEGTVDFASGALDNRMVVTLPVHASLPWYAAYLALSNPAAAGVVLLGQQVFKDPIKRLASLVYNVKGTYDDPEVVDLSGVPSVTGAAGDEPAAPGEPEEAVRSRGRQTGGAAVRSAENAQSAEDAQPAEKAEEGQ